MKECEIRIYCKDAISGIVDVVESNHWMDSTIAVKYLDWLKCLYPNKKIGLIWDHAGPHICQGVIQHAETLGIVVAFINKGMTSVQQPCDLFANQQIKSIIKEQYYTFRMTLDFASQSKVKVPMEMFVTWVEKAVDAVDKKQRKKNGSEENLPEVWT